MACFICGKDFGKHVRHPYLCAGKHRHELTKLQVRYEQLCCDTGRRWTRNEIATPYTEGKALPFFRDTYGLSYSQTQSLLDFFGVRVRTHAEAVNLPEMKARRRKTCRAKYGVENPSQCQIVKAKKVDTFRQHYGADNIFATPGFSERINTIMLAKYGKGSVPNINGKADSFGWSNASHGERQRRSEAAVRGFRQWYDSLTDEQRVEYAQKRATGFVAHYNSALEERVATILDTLGVPYKRQFFLERRSYDFRIKGAPLLVEVHGDFWHANPLIYKSDDLLSKPGGVVRASELWEKDTEKARIAKKWGYCLLVLWESFIKTTTDSNLAGVLAQHLVTE